MLQARSPGRATASLIDAAIATTGIGLFSWMYVIEPYAGRREPLAPREMHWLRCTRCWTWHSPPLPRAS